jgi:hypothetical protein
LIVLVKLLNHLIDILHELVKELGHVFGDKYKLRDLCLAELLLTVREGAPDLEELPVALNHTAWSHLRRLEELKLLFDVLVWVKEDFEFFRVVEVRAPCQLLDELVE